MRIGARNCVRREAVRLRQPAGRDGLVPLGLPQYLILFLRRLLSRSRRCEVPMRAFAALLLLVLTQLCSVVALASPVLEVGPVYLNGSGSLGPGSFDPPGFDLQFSATGADAAGDVVSINAHVVDDPDYPGAQTPVETFSYGVVPFGGPGCFYGYTTLISECTGEIDGIAGVATFTNIGGGEGQIQIFQDLSSPSVLFEAGPLLAQAEVISYSEITYLYVNPLFQSRYEEDFNLVSPEPSTSAMGWIGIFAFVCLRLRKISAK